MPKKVIEYDKIEVNTIELDELLKEKSIENQNICFWIDDEGLQKEVLEGSLFYLKNNCKFIKIEVESKEIFSEQKWLSKDVNKFLEKNNYLHLFRDFEFGTQFNVLYVKKVHLKEVTSIIKQSKIDVQKQINIQKIIFFLFNKQNFFQEAKRFFINILGSKIGNTISATFGSESSKDFLKYNK